MLDERLGVFVTVCADQARAAAAAADAELASGADRGPLHGIPVGVKDILATVDAPTTAQSSAFESGRIAGRDAAAVRGLRRAGAVVLGKTALSEFAIGLPDADTPFPYPRNAWNPEMWAGGSSAGTATGLAAGLFLGGLGTDTGGSIRLPAAFSGVSGLKPSRGLVPRVGCVPLAPSLDEVGPMATTARDCALLLDALMEPAYRPSFAAALDQPPGPLRVGVDRRHHGDHTGVDPAAIAAFERAVGAFECAGAAVVEVEIPDFELAAAATAVVVAVEALDCHRANLRTRWNDYGQATRLRIATGAFFDASEYARARRILEQLRVTVARALAHVDIVLTLTAGTGAWPIDGMALDAPSVAPLFTRAWNGLGFPALSVPMGFDARGLPLGLQVAGAPGADADVLRAGALYQEVTDWHRRRPAALPVVA